jgi:serine/threonine protein kinase/Flp pilus assembly protein TadD
MKITDADLWLRVQALFDEVIALPLSARAAHLERLGRTEPSVRALVEELIAADEVADECLGDLESAIAEIVRTEVGEPSSGVSDAMKLTGRTIGHFRVLDPIAAGGMGVVYRAEDMRLDRVVALKFPLPQYHADSSVKQRFLREARSAGALEHTNVCSIYETGESDDGHVFLAMPFYDGETVRSLIAREGCLPIPQALAIARQVADGLACAHGAGIVHRDLKPANLMLLPNGTVKILDFGLAKVRDLAQTASVATLGTAAYMAPEHVRGEPLDSRADLWALGVVLYEMLVGQRPFAGDHDVSIANAILTHDLIRPSSVRTEIPRSLDRIVLSLLQRNPDDRYDSAADLSLDLAAIARGETPPVRESFVRRSRRFLAIPRVRRRAAAVASLTAIVALAGLAIRKPGLNNNQPSKTALPTANLKAYELYLRGRDLQVRSSGSRTSLDLVENLYKRAIALDPNFALPHARLSTLYGDRNSSKHDYLPARDDSMRHEAEAALRLNPKLPEAHLAMGQYLASSHRYDSALVEFGMARRELPNDTDVLAAIAVTYRALGRWEEAVAALERAAQIDPQNLGIHGALGTTYSRLRRYKESVRNWDRIIADGPTDYGVWLVRGNTFLRWQGSADTLVAILRRAPLDFDPPGMRAWAEITAARVQLRYSDALSVVNRKRRKSDAVDSLLVYEDPTIYCPRSLMRAQIYTDAGKLRAAAVNFDSARVMLEAKVRALPNDARIHIALGLAYAGLARKEDAMREARRALELEPPSRDVLNGAAVMGRAAEVYALAGANDEALAMLDRLLAMPAGREASVPLLRVDPAYARLRKDARFEELLSRH